MSKTVIDPGVFGEPKTEHVSPFSIKESGFNPDNRTDPRALTKLKHDIRAAGNKVMADVHITSDSVLMDGHRRTAIAKELGIAALPAKRYGFSSADPRCKQLFNMLNRSGRAFKPADQLLSYLKGGDPASPSIKRDGDYLQDLLSDYEMEMFMDRGGSPYILRLAEKSAKYCYPGHNLSTLVCRSHIRKTIVWMIELNQQQPFRRYTEEFKASAAKLIKFITNNQPIEFPTVRARQV